MDALVEATARILVRDGFEAASTNRIAEKAGVSVGSLYQYYPCKEALVAAVIERHNQHLMRIVRDALAKVVAEPIEKGVRQLVTAAIDAHRFDPKLHKVLAEQVPRTGPLKDVDVFNRENYAIVKAYLERHQGELGVTDLELAAFVCVTSVESLTHSAVLHRPQMLSDKADGALVDEATRLVVGYLRGSRDTTNRQRQ